MLCLAAKEGDYVMIGDDIKIVFLKQQSSNQDQIHIGIVAPKSVAIRRDQVYEKELSDYAKDPGRTAEEVSNARKILDANKEDRMRLRSEKYKRMNKLKSDESRRKANEEAKREKVGAQPAGAQRTGAPE